MAKTRRGTRGGRKHNGSAVREERARLETNRRRWFNAVQKLAVTAHHSYKSLERKRNDRLTMLKMYAGDIRMGQNTSNPVMPFNVFHNALFAMAAQLTARNPIIELLPKTSDALRGYAEIVSHKMTELLREMDYQETNAMVVFDAMIFSGITRVGLGPTFRDSNSVQTEDLQETDEFYDPGEPYAIRISPNDFVIDDQSRTVRDASFIGHQYRATRDTLELLLSDHDIRQLTSYNEQMAQEKGLVDGPTTRTDESTFNRKYILTDIYTPPGVLSREGLLLTFPGRLVDLPSILEKRRGEDMLVREPVVYEGKEGGPYDLMVLDNMPDHPMGTPLASLWVPMAKMIGALSAHLIDAESSVKSIVLAGDAADEEDLNRIRTSKHADVVRVGQATKENTDLWTFKGAEAHSHQVLALFTDMFNRQSGNTDLLGGNQFAGDKTAREVDEVSERLNGVLESIDAKVHKHANSVATKLTHLVLSDPSLDEKVVLQTAGVPVSLTLDRDARGDSDFRDYNIQIQMGSMRRRPDRVRSAELERFAANTLPMSIQLAAITQGAFKVGPFLKLMAKGFLDTAELEAILDDDELAIANARLATMFPGSTASPSIAGAGAAGGPSAPGSTNAGSSSPLFGLSQLLQGGGLPTN